jgi:hypothetical protein
VCTHVMRKILINVHECVSMHDMNVCTLCTSFDYYNHIYLKLYSALNSFFSYNNYWNNIMFILMIKFLYDISMTQLKGLLLHALWGVNTVGFLFLASSSLYLWHLSDKNISNSEKSSWASANKTSKRVQFSEITKL